MTAHGSPNFADCSTELFYHSNSITSSDSFCSFHFLRILTNTNRLATTITFFFVFLFCTISTTSAYFKVFQIIRSHKRQFRANESARNFCHQAINLKKYTKSVFSICFIFQRYFTLISCPSSFFLDYLFGSITLNQSWFIQCIMFIQCISWFIQCIMFVSVLFARSSHLPLEDE